MRLALSTMIAACIFIGSVHGIAAAPAPSYAKQIKPFFAKYCLECHNGEKLKGGLNLETFKSLQAGGEHGPVLTAGKPDQSRVVLQVEHKAKPHMPPKKARQPKPEELALLRAWVAAGAKNDVTTLDVKIPDIKPRVPTTAASAALAYRPDGKLLAAGSYREVILIDVGNGEVVGRLPGQTGEVTAVEFSRDGRLLAVASGSPAKSGEVRLYAVPPHGLPGSQPLHLLAGHKDIILGIAFSPDGKLLATCGYDRLIKLWDTATGKELRPLKDHSDAVYGVAFSPDGRLLASGAADRAVKVWDVASGVRLYTLGESTDWVYTVAWSPDGRHLAAAGVDKSIRVWEAGPTAGKISHSVFAHQGPITRLVYSPDGKTLYSLSEDRTAKAWETAKMVERKVYSAQPETVLALAVRPDQKQLALGRYDGHLLLLDEATGTVQSEPLPVKPKPPRLAKITPSWGQRGKTVRLTLEGQHLENPTQVNAEYPGARIKMLADGRTPHSIQAEVTFPARTPAGVYQLHVKNAVGQSNGVPFTVDPFPAVEEKEPNDSPSTGQKIALPVTIVGAIGRAGDVDFYRFEAVGGQEIGVQALAGPLGSKLEPVLVLTDASGRVLMESTTGVLGYTCTKAGAYALGIRDREYRGGGSRHYRLHIGDIPVITSVFPLGLQRGTQAAIRVEGVNLSKAENVRRAPDNAGGGFLSAGIPVTVRVKAASAAPGTRLPVPVQSPKGAPLGAASVVVGEFPEVVDQHGGAKGIIGPLPVVPVPGTANGWVAPGQADTWRFQAKKGQQVIVAVNARRLESPLDSYIEVLDAKGRPVPRAVLRCVAKTYTTFRDHDSVGPGIRLETWSELAVNDYLLVGGELIRIRQLPKNPDDDCQFFSVKGQRKGFLDTTPTYHSLGTPMYKVAIYPPGTTFSPNGLPVFTLYYRNDDGGPGYGKDSRLFFDPPADGEYLVRVGDARGQGGDDYAYRLTIRPPRPSFNVSFNPTSPAVWKGGAVPIIVTVDRIDGFDGPIDIRLTNLPAGFSAPPTSIPAEEYSTAFALYAVPTAASSAKSAPLKLVAQALINGQPVVREVTGGLPKAVEQGDLVTWTDQPEVTVHPGSQVRLTAKIERRKGFKGRVPIDVLGLPHGIHVLDVGLNGILITEKDTSRTFVIYAEPWVKPITHPFVVLARNEGTGKEYAAKSVLLKVTPGH